MVGEEREKQLSLFVLKAQAHPEQVESKDVEALRALGWNDREVLEATHYGADVVLHGILFKAFKVDE